MMVFWVVVLAAVVLLVVWLVKQTQGGGTSSTTPGGESDTPREILKKRYARGEIDKAEYEEKLKDLDG